MKMKKHNRKKAFKALSKYSSDGKAAVFTLGFAYLFLIVEIVYKFKIQRQTCTWELLLLFLMFAVFGLVKKLFTNSASPKRFDGTALPTGDSEEDKKERNSYYKFSALLYSIVFSSVAFLGVLFSADILNVNLAVEFFFEKEVPNFIFSLVSTALVFGISYLFTYMIDFLWYENLIAYAKEAKEYDENETPDIKKDFKKIKSANKKALNKEKKDATQNEKEVIQEVSEEKEEEETEIKEAEKNTAENIVTDETPAPAPKKRGRPPKKALEKSPETQENKS